MVFRELLAVLKYWSQGRIRLFLDGRTSIRSTRTSTPVKKISKKDEDEVESRKSKTSDKNMFVEL